MTDLETRLSVLEQIVLSLGTSLAFTMQKVVLLEKAFVETCQENAELELALYAKTSSDPN